MGVQKGTSGLQNMAFYVSRVSQQTVNLVSIPEIPLKAIWTGNSSHHDHTNKNKHFRYVVKNANHDNPDLGFFFYFIAFENVKIHVKREIPQMPCAFTMAYAKCSWWCLKVLPIVRLPAQLLKSLSESQNHLLHTHIHTHANLLVLLTYSPFFTRT